MATITLNFELFAGGPPIVGPNSITVQQDSSGNTVQSVTISGPLDSIAVATQPTHGAVTVSGLTFLYTPTTGYTGADSFTYTGTNTNGTSAPATISVTVVAAVSYNCECDDDYPRATLAAMRDELRSRLGFMPEQDPAPARTLLDMRNSIIRRLGMAAQTVLAEMSLLIDDFLEDAQQTLYRAFEMDVQGTYPLQPFEADTDTTTLDPQAIFLLALANAKAHYGQPDAKNYADQYVKYLKDFMGRSPPNLTAVLNAILNDAQQQAYRLYRVFRLERYFTWNMVPGVRFYDFDANSDVCTKRMDPRMLTWVGISDKNEAWRPLVCGIRPEFYYSDVQGWPTHYEMRQCIEVWPAPADANYKLRIKGYFGLMPFEADTDVTTIDVEAVRLFALANAKAHFKQGDAANYMKEFKDYIGAVTAGSHHTRRYVPGADEYFTPPLPVLTGWPGDP